MAGSSSVVEKQCAKNAGGCAKAQPLTGAEIHKASDLPPQHVLQSNEDRTKMLKFLWEYCNPAPTMESPPPLVYLEATTHCNLKCVYCANEIITRGREFMELETYKAFLDKVKGQARVVYPYHSGEPLMHKDICTFIRLNKEAGAYTLIHSNAQLLNEAKASEILDSGLDAIEFSVDCIDREIYERTRVNGKADRAWTNVVRFLRMVRERNSPMLVRIRVVKSSNNEHLVDRELEIIKRLPFDEVRISLYLNNRNWEEDAPAYFPDGRPTTYCTLPWKQITFSPDGIGACAQDFDQEYPWGNLTDGSLMDVWNSQSLQDLRAAMLSGDIEQLKKVNDICWRCNARSKDKYTSPPDFWEQVGEYGVNFPAYYLAYLRLARTEAEQRLIDEKYAKLDETIRDFEAYAGYKVS